MQDGENQFIQLVTGGDHFFLSAMTLYVHSQLTQINTFITQKMLISHISDQGLESNKG